MLHLQYGALCACQISIFQISYDLNKKTEVLKEKQEIFNGVKLEIDRLKAPRLLESKLQKMDLDLILPQNVQIVKVPAIPQMTQPLQSSLSKSTGGFASSFDFFGKWVNVAQAKMDT